MNGVEPPLEVKSTQDNRRLSSLNTLTKFLDFPNSMCLYKRGDTLFIDMRALERKRGRIRV